VHLKRLAPSASCRAWIYASAEDRQDLRWPSVKSAKHVLKAPTHVQAVWQHVHYLRQGLRAPRSFQSAAEPEFEPVQSPD